MGTIETFFVKCSGVNEEILIQAPTEKNKYVGIGATVFFTGLFATVASGYALFTVFDSYISAFFFAILWGLLIFNLDRFIVSSLKKKGSFFRDFGLALPRIILAVIISIVIAKPLELKIFETEINAEIISMQQERRKEHEDLLKARFAEDLTTVENEITALKKELGDLQMNKEKLTIAALAEADGTGGSKIRNMGKIYKAKVEAADAASQAFNNKQTELAPMLAAKELRKKELLDLRDAEMKKMEHAALTGFASRLEALGRLTDKSHHIYLASIFLMLLFIAIESAPIFVKLISERAPYDFILDKVETVVELDHKEFTTLSRMEIDGKIDYEVKKKQHQVKEQIAAENELFSHALKEEVEQIKNRQHGLSDYLKRQKLYNIQG
jgi:hypothetical protein